MQEQIKLALIDDDQGVLRALGLLLKTMHYDVTLFNSPADAIDFLRTHPAIDVVITDLRMPVLSGEVVVTEVKRIDDTLPVIVMSGHASSTDLDLLRQRGADAFLPKPFTPDQLTQVVDSVMQGAGKAREKTGCVWQACSKP